jgi:large subunit ribosomal protein L24
MRLRKGDNVVVVTGKDKGKSGEITAILPKAGKVVVTGVNVVKRHTKPSSKQPQGGILELTKPIDASKVMAVDPQTGVPGRIGYRINPDGSKERIFKTSKRQKVKKA